ncbi:MAG: glycosyltransferase [Candidatus Thioglobus sp.]|nr:MAG: glycosyltransferase [Candidatus Thioglobus sp.]
MSREFSVLISIYQHEIADYFDRAMRSIWDEQTIKPNEIVLVLDGPLTSELYKSADNWKTKLGNLLNIVVIENYVGTGSALNAGLKQCRYELVAKMDADDISLKNRFAKQLDIFDSQSVDIVGGWVGEFYSDEKAIHAYRKLPEQHQNIIRFAKKRCPMNHPTVMYKKSVILDSGGYPNTVFFEDYLIYIKAAINGAQFYNIQEPLVNMRTINHLNRRRGWHYAIKDCRTQINIFQLGFISFFELIRNISVRFTIRILPKTIVGILYKKIRTAKFNP